MHAALLRDSGHARDERMKSLHNYYLKVTINLIEFTLYLLNSLSVSNIPVRSLRELAQYYHQAPGCPAASTLLRAAKNFLQLPGLSHAQLLKQQDALLVSVATDKGHLDQVRQGQRSTKSLPHHQHLTTAHHHSSCRPRRRC